MEKKEAKPSATLKCPPASGFPVALVSPKPLMAVIKSEVSTQKMSKHHETLGSSELSREYTDNLTKVMAMSEEELKNSLDEIKSILSPSSINFLSSGSNKNKITVKKNPHKRKELIKEQFQTFTAPQPMLEPSEPSLIKSDECFDLEGRKVMDFNKARTCFITVIRKFSQQLGLSTEDQILSLSSELVKIICGFPFLVLIEEKNNNINIESVNKWSEICLMIRSEFASQRHLALRILSGSLERRGAATALEAYAPVRIEGEGKRKQNSGLQEVLILCFNAFLKRLHQLPAFTSVIPSEFDCLKTRLLRKICCRCVLAVCAEDIPLEVPALLRWLFSSPEGNSAGPSTFSTMPAASKLTGLSCLRHIISSDTEETVSEQLWSAFQGSCAQWGSLLSPLSKRVDKSYEHYLFECNANKASLEDTSVASPSVGNGSVPGPPKGTEHEQLALRCRWGAADAFLTDGFTGADNLSLLHTLLRFVCDAVGRLQTDPDCLSLDAFTVSAITIDVKIAIQSAYIVCDLVRLGNDLSVEVILANFLRPGWTKILALMDTVSNFTHFRNCEELANLIGKLGSLVWKFVAEISKRSDSVLDFLLLDDKLLVSAKLLLLKPLEGLLSDDDVTSPHISCVKWCLRFLRVCLCRGKCVSVVNTLVELLLAFKVRQQERTMNTSKALNLHKSYGWDQLNSLTWFTNDDGLHCRVLDTEFNLLLAVSVMATSTFLCKSTEDRASTSSTSRDSVKADDELNTLEAASCLISHSLSVVTEVLTRTADHFAEELESSDLLFEASIVRFLSASIFVSVPYTEALGLKGFRPLKFWVDMQMAKGLNDNRVLGLSPGTLTTVISRLIHWSSLETESPDSSLFNARAVVLLGACRKLQNNCESLQNSTFIHQRLRTFKALPRCFSSEESFHGLTVWHTYETRLAWLHWEVATSVSSLSNKGDSFIITADTLNRIKSLDPSLTISDNNDRMGSSVAQGLLHRESREVIPNAESVYLISFLSYLLWNSSTATWESDEKFREHHNLAFDLYFRIVRSCCTKLGEGMVISLLHLLSLSLDRALSLAGSAGLLSSEPCTWEQYLNSSEIKGNNYLKNKILKIVFGDSIYDSVVKGESNESFGKFVCHCQSPCSSFSITAAAQSRFPLPLSPFWAYQVLASGVSTGNMEGSSLYSWLAVLLSEFTADGEKLCLPIHGIAQKVYYLLEITSAEFSNCWLRAPLLSSDTPASSTPFAENHHSNTVDYFHCMEPHDEAVDVFCRLLEKLSLYAVKQDQELLLKDFEEIAQEKNFSSQSMLRDLIERAKAKQHRTKRDNGEGVRTLGQKLLESGLGCTSGSSDLHAAALLVCSMGPGGFGRCANGAVRLKVWRELGEQGLIHIIDHQSFLSNTLHTQLFPVQVSNEAVQFLAPLRLESAIGEEIISGLRKLRCLGDRNLLAVRIALVQIANFIFGDGRVVESAKMRLLTQHILTARQENVPEWFVFPLFLFASRLSALRSAVESVLLGRDVSSSKKMLLELLDYSTAVGGNQNWSLVIEFTKENLQHFEINNTQLVVSLYSYLIKFTE